ncbi:MAG: hypothetical protein NTX22_00225 [Ignavibacteriales bacterium]|nr:hypothetical protein [Ignavibacteriales bacterium]
MSISELKENLHSLVNDVNDPGMLEFVYKIFNVLKQQTIVADNYWNVISELQRAEILQSFEESEDNANLDEHETVMAKYKNVN